MSFSTGVCRLRRYGPPLERLTKAYDGKLRRVMTDAANAFSVSMPEAKAIALSQAPGVVLVEENGYWNLAGATSHWHLDRIDQVSGTDGNYSACYTGAGVTAYVVDTGVASTHQEFQKAGGGSKVLDGVNYSNDTHSSINPCGGYSNDENNTQWTYNAGHGTSIASLIAGNTVGVAPGAEIVSVKVANCPSNAPPVMVTEHLAWGLDWIRSLDNPYRARRPAVVNLSLFVQLTDSHVSSVEHVINGLVLTDYDLPSGRPQWQGIPVVASANNKDQSACSFSPSRMAWSNPGDDEWSSPGHVISVGGTRQSDIRWDCAHPSGDTCSANDPGSNFGICADIYAPAHNITSASLKNASAYREQYIFRSGTSFSSAITTGIVAHYLEKAPTLTPSQVWNRLLGRSTTLANSGDPHTTGSIKFVQLPICGGTE